MTAYAQVFQSFYFVVLVIGWVDGLHETFLRSWVVFIMAAFEGSCVDWLRSLAECSQQDPPYIGQLLGLRRSAVSHMLLIPSQDYFVHFSTHKLQRWPREGFLWNWHGLALYFSQACMLELGEGHQRLCNLTLQWQPGTSTPVTYGSPGYLLCHILFRSSTVLLGFGSSPIFIQGSRFCFLCLWHLFLRILILSHISGHPHLHRISSFHSSHFWQSPSYPGVSGTRAWFVPFPLSMMGASLLQTYFHSSQENGICSTCLSN